MNAEATAGGGVIKPPAEALRGVEKGRVPKDANAVVYGNDRPGRVLARANLNAVGYEAFEVEKMEDVRGFCGRAKPSLVVITQESYDQNGPAVVALMKDLIFNNPELGIALTTTTPADYGACREFIGQLGVRGRYGVFMRTDVGGLKDFARGFLTETA